MSNLAPLLLRDAIQLALLWLGADVPSSTVELWNKIFEGREPTLDDVVKLLQEAIAVPPNATKAEELISLMRAGTASGMQHCLLVIQKEMHPDGKRWRPVVGMVHELEDLALLAAALRDTHDRVRSGQHERERKSVVPGRGRGGGKKH